MNRLIVLVAASLVFAACASSAPEEIADDTEQGASIDPCATVRCAAGTTPKRRGKTCVCVPNKGGAGEACGSVTCPSGEVCCNASCGICTPPDGACIQIACL